MERTERESSDLGGDDLRSLARELLDAEEAYRFAPTLANTSRLSRARRRLESVLAVGARQ